MSVHKATSLLEKVEFSIVLWPRDTLVRRSEYYFCTAYVDDDSHIPLLESSFNPCHIVLKTQASSSHQLYILHHFLLTQSAVDSIIFLFGLVSAAY